MKQLSDLFKGTGNFINRGFQKIARTLYVPELSIKDKAWGPFCDAGGESLRFKYNLNENAVVFDLGGYEGQWASDIYGMFRCKVYLFEVYIPYVDNIKKRFSSNPSIKIFGFGLSSENATSQISIDAFSTSAFKKSEKMAAIELKKIDEFLVDQQIENIDLMKINIEGGEYDLLDYMVEKDLVKHVKNFQIQFHDFVPNALSRMNEIRMKLSKTHVPTYQFDFIWENWELKK